MWCRSSCDYYQENNIKVPHIPPSAQWVEDTALNAPASLQRLMSNSISASVSVLLQKSLLIYLCNLYYIKAFKEVELLSE